MKRLRTIPACIRRLKEEDSGCAITEYAVRNAIKEGSLEYKVVGKRVMTSVSRIIRRFTP